jgi:hypothetical protein
LKVIYLKCIKKAFQLCGEIIFIEEEEAAVLKIREFSEKPRLKPLKQVLPDQKV